MLALKVYRMLKRVEELNRTCEMYDWEYDTATSNDCGKFLTDDFFHNWNAYLEKLHTILDELYRNSKMRKIAEILDKDVAIEFRCWDEMPDEPPFM